MYKVAMVGRDRGNAWARQQGFPLTWADQAIALPGVQSFCIKNTLSPQHAALPGMIGQLSSGRVLTLNHFHHGLGDIVSLLEGTLTLDVDSSSLHTMLLPKLPPVDLQNTFALSTVMVFSTQHYF